MIGYYLLGILGLGLLMVVHEAGHMLAARSFGMRVTRFSIGFGPTLVRVEPEEGWFWLVTAAGKVRVRLFRHDPARHGPTVYQIALIPFLAYVQVAGMNPMEELEPDDKGSYANASVFGRIVTIAGGPLANYLFASVLFFLSLFFGGRLVPSEHPTEISPMPDHPAAVAGLEAGDRVVEINRTATPDWKTMAEAISASAGKPVEVVVERAGERKSFTVTPRSEGGRGLIGVRPMHKRQSVGVGESLRLSLERPALVVRELAIGLYQVFTRKTQPELAGPVGIVKETARVAKSGWTDLVDFLAMLSAYLGAFNLIPFPALDGGRLVFLGFEAATRRKPNATAESAVHFVGLVLLLSLIGWVTFAKDLR
jgi:regulator of sigma E protease